MSCWGPWEPRKVHNQRRGRCLTLVLQGSAEGTSTFSPGGSGAPLAHPYLHLFNHLKQVCVLQQRWERGQAEGSAAGTVKPGTASNHPSLPGPLVRYQEGATKTLREGLCTTDPPEFGQLPSDVSPEPRSWISGRRPNSVCFLEGGGCCSSRGRDTFLSANTMISVVGLTCREGLWFHSHPQRQPVH